MLSLMPGLWLSLVCALPTEARYLCGRLEMVISGGLCSQVSATLEIRLTLLAMRAVCVCMTRAFLWPGCFCLLSPIPIRVSLFHCYVCISAGLKRQPLPPQGCYYKRAPPRSAPQGVLFLLWVGPTMLPNLQGSAQVLPPPCPLVSSVSTPCSLLRCPLYPLPCGFEGLGRAVPLCSVLWQPLDSLILLIGLCPWASPGPLWFVSGALVHLLLYLSSSSLRSQ